NWMGMRRYLAGASVWSRSQTGWRMMRTNIPEKLSNIVKEIDDHGSASLTRLTVLKKWFERTERLSAFAIWIATRAVSRQGKTSGAAAKLLREARGMLAGLDRLHSQLDRHAGGAWTGHLPLASGLSDAWLQIGCGLLPALRLAVRKRFDRPKQN